MFRRLLRRGRLTEFGDPLRPAAYPLGGAVPVAGRDLRLRDLQTLRRTDDGGGAERRLPGPGCRCSPVRRAPPRTGGKYIPVTMESLWWNHTLGMRDVATVFSANYPKSRVFEGKTLTLGGSCSREGRNLVGDLSALLIHEERRFGAAGSGPRGPRRRSFRISTRRSRRSAANASANGSRPLRACRRGIWR